LNNEKIIEKIDISCREVSLAHNRPECSKSIPVFQVQEKMVKKRRYEVKVDYSLHQRKNYFLRSYINQTSITMNICQVYE
jgi:hypothetical protein